MRLPPKQRKIAEQYLYQMLVIHARERAELFQKFAPRYEADLCNIIDTIDVSKEFNEELIRLRKFYRDRRR